MHNQYNPKIHHRRSIRLRGYDYSQAGAYFITICTQNRLHLFGEIVNGKMILNGAGKMVEQTWNEIPVFYDGLGVNEYVVMPNHFHGVIVVGAGPCACPDNGPRACLIMGNHGGLPLRRGWGILLGVLNR